VRSNLRGLLLALAVAAFEAPAEAESLRLGYAVGPDTATVDLVLRRWAQGLSFRPDSDLTITLDPGPTSAAQLGRRFASDAVDLAWLQLDTVAPAAHPLQLLELPLQGYPAEVVSRAAAGLLAHTSWSQAGAATILMAVAEAPLWLHMNGTAAGLNGLRLRAPTAASADWLMRLGAAPVDAGIDAPIDGALASWSGLVVVGAAGRFAEHLQVGAPPDRAAALTRGLGTALWVLAVRTVRLKAMTPAAREALIASTGVEVATVAGSGVDRVDHLAQERARRPGDTLRRVGAEPLAAWRTAAVATEDELVAALGTHGYDGKSLRHAALLALVRANSLRGEEAEARTKPPRGMGG
jgi:hypothetical protein